MDRIQSPNIRNSWNFAIPGFVDLEKIARDCRFSPDSQGAWSTRRTFFTEGKGASLQIKYWAGRISLIGGPYFAEATIQANDRITSQERVDYERLLRRVQQAAKYN
jgi:hypothetical protein